MSRHEITMVATTTLALMMSPAGSLQALANCGSESCPIDMHALGIHDESKFSLDFSYQHIDQSHPRIGTHGAHVGELLAEHDEVRTLNRQAQVTLRWAPLSRFHASIAVPWIQRTHDHIETDYGETYNPEHWNLNALGDIRIEGHGLVVPFKGHGHDGIWLFGGIELPTGKDSVKNGEGELAEVPVQPGSGSWDYVMGTTIEYGFSRKGALLESRDGASHYHVPVFATLTYRRNGESRDGYRIGGEWQLSAGVAMPLVGKLSLLMQVNGRKRERDTFPPDDLEPNFTGGKSVLVSPGLQLGLGKSWSAYTYAQLPVYQNVNGLQLTSRINYIGGVQVRF